MLSTNNLEKLIELEEKLRGEYQTQLDAKTAEIEAAQKKLEEQQAVIAKQLEQIKAMSGEAATNKQSEQQNRELENRSAKQLDEISSQKKRIKSLQGDLATERSELKTLRQYDPLKMKKNLDSNKKKLAEKAKATDLLQKSLNKQKGENASLERQVKELEAKLAELEPEEELEQEAETEAAA